MPAERETISVPLDPQLLKEAEAMSIDLSRAAEAGIARAVVSERAARDWAEENAEAVRSTNEYIAKHGLPLRKYRSF